MANGLGKVKIGKSAGQKAAANKKAVDKAYLNSKNWEYGVEDVGTFADVPESLMPIKSREHIQKDLAAKANVAAAKKLAKDAAAGKKKAEKALGKKIPKSKPSDIFDVKRKPKPSKIY